MKKNAPGGKGSAPRKDQDQKKYAENYDLIFGKKKKQDENSDSVRSAS